MWNKITLTRTAGSSYIPMRLTTDSGKHRFADDAWLHSCASLCSGFLASAGRLLTNNEKVDSTGRLILLNAYTLSCGSITPANSFKYHKCKAAKIWAICLNKPTSHPCMVYLPGDKVTKRNTGNGLLLRVYYRQTGKIAIIESWWRSLV